MHHASTPAATNVQTATAAEILALFEWYGFEDSLGHDLTWVIPFLQLVERATGEKMPRLESVPVLVEEHGEAGTSWVVSFDGSNPRPEYAVQCATREDAERLMTLVGGDRHVLLCRAATVTVAS